jgi:AraC family transcriptional regulator
VCGQGAFIVNANAASFKLTHELGGRLPVTRQQIDRVLSAIHSRYHEPDLCLSHLARLANVSPWHLSRVIKETTGRGFIQHLHCHRIAAAHDLIAQSKLSVKEIAAAVGYKSVTQLDRHFRRAYGITPSARRMACWSLRSTLRGKCADRKN